eukprot:5707062-Prymnesium_polylepis.1
MATMLVAVAHGLLVPNLPSAVVHEQPVLRAIAPGGGHAAPPSQLIFPTSLNLADDDYFASPEEAKRLAEVNAKIAAQRCAAGYTDD